MSYKTRRAMPFARCPCPPIMLGPDQSDPFPILIKRREDRLSESALSLCLETDLLDFDLGAGLFQLLLGLISRVLADTGQNLAACGFCHRLGITQAQARQLADHLDDVDLLRACILDDHVEFA